jgi:hypothetical protein
VLRLWDSHAVWTIAYIYLLSHAFVSGYRYGWDGPGTLWYAFLLTNLAISLGVGYQALLRRFHGFQTWAPLVLRWTARFILYGVILFLLPVYLYLVPMNRQGEHWPIASVIAFYLVMRHVADDIERTRQTSRVRV